ncbi:root hair specific 4 [Quillaja saponaria]|uniref:Root hair specific 4 n=1 Tax=Quillaja saponaria TaxID=32244 RepID=A0AAD7M3M4_QUISA|nr:root hair specific 4 [Quillaja saponaria]
MELQVSDTVIFTSKHGFQEADESIKVEAGFELTAEDLFPKSTMDGARISFIDSLQKEKQILVDPKSLKESSFREASFSIMLPPDITTPEATVLQHLPPLQPPKPKFLSCSLPNSANSSPRFTSFLSKKKLKDDNQVSISSPLQDNNFAQKLHNLQQEIHLRRSKSCGEGRVYAPMDEFDLWLSKPNVIDYSNRHHGSFSKTEAVREGGESSKNMDAADEGFKCSALCLFLPGFGKGKPVRSRKEVAETENVISRTVSLEKFECGSWASSAIMQDNEGGDSANLYFDLPLELIRSSMNDAHSPVKAAFVFDKEPKGVLKNGSRKANGNKSDASPRHVRFSTSSPSSYPASPASCITPRLLKAREEFNAFLEAQSA